MLVFLQPVSGHQIVLRTQSTISAKKENFRIRHHFLNVISTSGASAWYPLREQFVNLHLLSLCSQIANSLGKQLFGVSTGTTYLSYESLLPIYTDLSYTNVFSS
jgi:hypothetical protein